MSVANPWMLASPLPETSHSDFGLPGSWFSVATALRVLISQCAPAKPAGQLHVKLAIPSVQIPPCWHGALAHSSTSTAHAASIRSKIGVELGSLVARSTAYCAKRPSIPAVAPEVASGANALQHATGNGVLPARNAIPALVPSPSVLSHCFPPQLQALGREREAGYEVQ